MVHDVIDMHSHFLPPEYALALVEHGILMPDGMAGIPGWDVESHLAYMDTVGVKKSILSLSSPGTHLTLDITHTKALTRESNEYAANLKREHPDRFGFFASLPLPDIDGAMAEIKYALDNLNPDGFIIESNAHGHYLGDPKLRRVLGALNRRGALVFIHPTSPCQLSPHPPEDQTYAERYAVSSPLAPYYSAPMFEFFFDSARTAIDLLATGTVLRFADIRWIFTHSGSVLPLLIERMFLFMKLPHFVGTGRDPLPITEEQVLKAFKEKFWFDLAGVPVPSLIDALLKFTEPDRLLFGTDVPWTPWDLAKTLLVDQEEGLIKAVGEENMDLISHKTAEKLLSQ
ncbi:MAG: hypothetical protein Q9191_001568 [Dirinaria sp. TL-2023a]